MDELANAVRVEPKIDPSSFNSLFIASRELGALIPVYDPAFLSALTDIYDNSKYDEKRRGNKEPLIIDRPQINLLAATQPAFLMDSLPASAWDQGFLSRVIIVYKDFVTERRLNLHEEEPPRNILLEQDLIADLQAVAARTGKMLFKPDAAELLEDWAADKNNRPAHPRLLHYTSRRPINTIKLSMIAAVDSNHADIEQSDVRTAIDWLMTAEKEMPDMFTQFKSGGDAAVISETHHFCVTYSVRKGGSVPAPQIYDFLRGRVPSYRVQPIVDVMIRSGMIKAEVKDGITLFSVNPSTLGMT